MSLLLSSFITFYILNYCVARGTPPPSLGIREYNATQSSTAILFDGQTFNVGYGSGSATGVVYLDEFSINASDFTLGIGNNPIECEISVEGQLSTIYDINGIFGLSMV